MFIMCMISFFFFTAPPTPEIYTLSLHDALPISGARRRRRRLPDQAFRDRRVRGARARAGPARTADLGDRSEEHTSELQSRRDLVCRLLLEKKKNLFCL